MSPAATPRPSRVSRMRAGSSGTNTEPPVTAAVTVAPGVDPPDSEAPASPTADSPRTPAHSAPSAVARSTRGPVGRATDGAAMGDLPVRGLGRDGAPDVQVGRSGVG